KLSSINPNTSISSGQYSISSAKELKQLADMTNSGKITGGEFVLACDIDLSEYSDGEGWKPISSWSANCTFNGNGNIITGLKINRGDVDRVGLFGYNTGTIKNLGIEDCDVTNTCVIASDEPTHVGAIVGTSKGSASIIENCYSTGTVKGARMAGGIVGHIVDSAIVKYCYSNVEVTTTMEGNSGGIAGYTGSDSLITSCFATGDVYSATGAAGGLVGTVKKSEIDNCYAIGDVTATSGQDCGGLVGYLNGTLSNSYAMGNVMYDSYSGGLVGRAKDQFNISNCYSTGNLIETGSYSGGLIGTCSISSESFIENCMSYGDIYSNAGNCGGFIGRIFNSTNKLTIKNSTAYSKFNDPSQVSADNKKCGSFIGMNQNTNDRLNAGTLIIENCGAVEQGLKKLDCYIYEGGVYKTWSYDGLDDLLAGVKTVQKPKQEISLQIGTQGDSASQIDFNSKVDTRLFNKIKKIDITDSNSIQDLDNILQSINEKQTSLGTSQNRLESALEEVAVQYENLVSSRSTLRDADIAKESAKLVQQQILQQASATLMATSSNITQQNVLGLLQGLRR
ncbi:hypothetical protein IJ384_02130, partial [bacterium]|nr:hypothetical protein [bacterium]